MTTPWLRSLRGAPNAREDDLRRIRFELLAVEPTAKLEGPCGYIDGAGARASTPVLIDCLIGAVAGRRRVTLLAQDLHRVAEVTRVPMGMPPENP